MKYYGVEDIRIKHNLNKDSIVFEVGGWTGNFSTAISQEFDCYVYIFEPLKDVYKNLLEKYKNNNKIKIFNFGLGKTNELKNINILGDGSSFYIKETDSQEQVSVRNINEVIKELDLKTIDLIELNCEGSEYDIIETISEETIKSITKLQIQFHEIPSNNLNQLKKECEDKLSLTHRKEWGYSWFECWEKNQ